MAYVKKDDTASAEKQTVRVTVTSRHPERAEAFVATLLTKAREEKVPVRGPVRLPTRTLKITTRKTPCGNGTNTWDTFELKIYKRLVDLTATTEKVRAITSFPIEAGVDVAIMIPNHSK